MFALQFKSPKHKPEGLLSFDIDLQQLRKLQAAVFSDWVYYAMPYFTLPDFQQSALHLVNFTRPLQIPSLEPRTHYALHWRPPFFMLEFPRGEHPDQKELEIYKIFDGFVPRGWALSRKASTISDGTLRYEVPHTSWGEFFNLLLTMRVGRHLVQQSDIEKFIDQLRDVPFRIQNSILVALDLLKRTVELLVVIPIASENNSSATHSVLF